MSAEIVPLLTTTPAEPVLTPAKENNASPLEIEAVVAELLITVKSAEVADNVPAPTTTPAASYATAEIASALEPTAIVGFFTVVTTLAISP